jgi:formate-dependent nitrite reductase membrane component NrfD
VGVLENLVLNDVWGFEIAVEMTFLAIASFSIVLAYLSFLEGRSRDALIGGVLATVLPILSLIILNLHLLKPEASYLVFASFQPRSWMPYGATGMTLLIITSAIFTALIKLNKEGVATHATGILASLAGVFVALYTGLLIAYERGIPFWHSGVIPLIALAMGAVGGLSVYSIIRPLDTRVTFSLGIALLLLALTYIIHIHVSLQGPLASIYSAQTALGSTVFKAGILAAIVGGLLGIATLKVKSKYLPIAIAVLGLLSILALRHVLLASGAWELPIL